MSKHIIITGASRGIGYETAKFLVDRGCSVTAIARSKKRLNQLRALNPEQLFILPLDITGIDAPGVILDHLDRHDLSIDGFINNAGNLINKSFVDLTDNDWKTQLDVNFTAPVRMIRELISRFNPKAHIVNIGSMGGFQGSDKFPGLSAYSASKGALSILTECLAVELKQYGDIRVNCLCLGAVQTEMLEEAFPGIEAPVDPSEMAQFIGDFTMKAGTFMNGKILPVSLSNPE